MKSLITTLAVLALAANFAAATTSSSSSSSTTTKKHHRRPAPIGEKTRMTPEQRFNKLDSNHDGTLTLDEFKAGRLGQRDPAKAEEVFNRMDKKHNGKVTLDEYTSSMGAAKAEIKSKAESRRSGQ
jgi:Ca2+-binding EF-hand superfamily protein